MQPLTPFHPVQPHAPQADQAPWQGLAGGSSTNASNGSPGIAAQPLPTVSRNVLIVVSVLALHIAFIWALKSGLLRRAAEIIIPAEMLAQLVTPLAEVAPPPPAPKPVTPPTPPKLPTPQKQVAAKAPSTPQPQPLAINDPTPSANAPSGVTSPSPPAAAPAAAPAEAAPAAVSRPVEPALDARYSDQDKATYPALSRRLGEEGTVVHSVLIGVNGNAISARLVKSSGFERLDKAAYEALMRSHFTPARRNGVAVEQSLNAPIAFVLSK